MKLWTWHGTDFSLTCGRVDHSLSQYYNCMPSIPPAYAELARRVGTDQIIWCYARPDPDEYEDLKQIKWVLDVSDDRILAIISSPIWERIICTKALPPALREKWKCEAFQGKHDDSEAYIEEKSEEYFSQPPPEGGWWTDLFISDIGAEGARVLLKHPIPDSWVVHRGTNTG